MKQSSSYEKLGTALSDKCSEEQRIRYHELGTEVNWSENQYETNDSIKNWTNVIRNEMKQMI